MYQSIEEMQSGCANFAAWDQLFQEAAAHRFPGKPFSWLYLKAQAMVESNLNPMAYNKGSKAAGIAQFLPESFQWLGLDPADRFKPDVSIPAMADLMAYLMGTGASSRPPFKPFMAAPWAQRWLLALGGYNAGWGNIMKAAEIGGALEWGAVANGLPKVTGGHSAETIEYVHRIVTYAGILEGKPAGTMPAILAAAS